MPKTSDTLNKNLFICMFEGSYKAGLVI